MFAAFAAGLVSDKFGASRTLGVACVLVGIAGALRGLSGGFTSLAIYMFLFGLFCIPLTFTTHKAAGEWFSERQLGLANGLLALGMGLGTTTGSMFSATVLSPMLGGWRNVMFVYGIIAVVIGLLWLKARRYPHQYEATQLIETAPFRQALSHVIRIRDVWLLALFMLFINGYLCGLTGYLPLYLKKLGWSGFSADGALSALNLAATVGGIPLTLLSDRIGRRKTILMTAMVISVIGASLLPVAVNTFVFVWIIVIAMGAFRAAYQALSTTVCLESEFAGAEYTGIATGFLFTINRLAAFAFPPTGNSLAGINIGLPFVFWAALFAIGMLILTQMKETGWKARSSQ